MWGWRGFRTFSSQLFRLPSRHVSFTLIFPARVKSASLRQLRLHFHSALYCIGSCGPYTVTLAKEHESPHFFRRLWQSSPLYWRRFSGSRFFITLPFRASSPDRAWSRLSSV